MRIQTSQGGQDGIVMGLHRRRRDAILKVVQEGSIRLRSAFAFEPPGDWRPAAPGRRWFAVEASFGSPLNGLDLDEVEFLDGRTGEPIDQSTTMCIRVDGYGNLVDQDEPGGSALQAYFLGTAPSGLVSLALGIDGCMLTTSLEPLSAVPGRFKTLIYGR